MSAGPFAARVRRAMEERGVSLRALCREAGLDASFFSKVLSGKRSPPSDEAAIARLAAALGLDPAMLSVAAGRIPSQWRRLMEDPELFDELDRRLSGRARRVPAPRPGPGAGAEPAPAGGRGVGRPAASRAARGPAAASGAPAAPDSWLSEELL